MTERVTVTVNLEGGPAVAKQLRQEAKALELIYKEQAAAVVGDMRRLADALDAGRQIALVGDELLNEATVVYEEEYRRCWPRGGDAQDHDEAQREALAAVIALVEGKKAAS